MPDELTLDNFKDQMITEAQLAAGDLWVTIRQSALIELNAIAANIAFLYALQLGEEKTAKHFRIQKNAAEAWKESLEGQSKLAAEKATNGAMALIRVFINQLFGFELIV